MSKPEYGSVDIDWDDPINGGLVCRYLFNEAAGGRVADLAGSNHATLTSFVSSTPWVNPLAFDGVASYCSLLRSLSLPTWTIGAYVNLYRTPIGAFSRILGTASFQLDFAVSNLGLLSVYDGTWRQFGSAISLNTRLHLMATYDGTNLRAYVNGSQAGSTITAGRSLSGTADIGRAQGGSANADDWWKGEIQELTIHNNPISDSQVKAIASAGPGGWGLIDLRRRSSASSSVNAGGGIIGGGISGIQSLILGM